MADSKPYWSVTVSIDGNEVLTIEKDCLGGIHNIDDYAEQVRECARHLLAFIGDGEEPADLFPPDDGQPTEQEEWRDFDSDC